MTRFINPVGFLDESAVFTVDADATTNPFTPSHNGYYVVTPGVAIFLARNRDATDADLPVAAGASVTVQLYAVGQDHEADTLTYIRQGATSGVVAVTAVH